MEAHPDSPEQVKELRAEEEQTKESPNLSSANEWTTWEQERRQREKEQEWEKLERRRERQLTKERLEKTRKAEETKSTLLSQILFVVGLLFLGGIAYIFRSSLLAAIPLLGMALFTVCWIPFQKFAKLERIEAVFEPSGLRFGVSNQKNELADQYARLQSRKAELEIIAVERRIELLDSEKRAADEKRLHHLGSGV